MATLHGSLDSSHSPFVTIAVSVPSGPSHFVDALIDTGFSGDIVVPATKELLQSTPGAYATWTMADGSEVLAPIFLGTIRFPDLAEDAAEMVGVTVTVLGDQALIGQSVLKHFTLTLDHGKQVILEP